jgi:hypothetical protein
MRKKPRSPLKSTLEFGSFLSKQIEAQSGAPSRARKFSQGEAKKSS